MKTEIERLRAELDEIADALPGVAFMDPPDGGSPTIAEQVRRAIAALKALDAERDRLRELLREAGTVMREVHEGRRHPQLALSIIARIDAALSKEKP